GAPRIGRGQHAAQLGPDPLARKMLQTVLVPRAAFQTVGIRPSFSVPGKEAEEAQDAQIVLADAIVRIADEAQATGADVVDAANQVHYPAVRLGIEAVDGEVTPLGIGFPVSSETNHGAAAVGGDILA